MIDCRGVDGVRIMVMVSCLRLEAEAGEGFRVYVKKGEGDH